MDRHKRKADAAFIASAIALVLMIFGVHRLYMESARWEKEIVTICERQLVEQLRTHHHETSPTSTCRRDPERWAVCVTRLRGEAAYFQCNGYGFATPMPTRP